MEIHVTSDTIDEFCKDHHIDGINRIRLDRLIRKEAERIYQLENSFRYSWENRVDL